MVGQFKDDALKNHTHGITDPGHNHKFIIYGGSGGYGVVSITGGSQGLETTQNQTTGITINSSGQADVTRTKSKGVKFIIKVL